MQNSECRIVSEKEKKMDIDLILKVAGIGMIITVICQVMSKAGKEEQSGMVSLAGTVIILILIAERIGDLISTLRTAFGI
jgi:stage III sporulation protein AC